MMKTLPKLLFFVVFSHAVGCQNNTTTSTGNERSTAATDSAQNVRLDSRLQDDAQAGEKNDYAADSLKPAMMPVSYNKVHDTFYGYRTGDTLLVDGDIKIPFPAEGEKAVATTRNLWSKNPAGLIVIPYEIASTYAYPQRVEEGLKMWTDKLPTIRFIKRTFQRDYFVTFVPSKYTQSNIGRQPEWRGQTIELAGDAMAGNIAHEIGHTLGLYHEQTRYDRDDFVTIKNTCINSYDYMKALKTDLYAKDIGGYDYNSIMHYPPSECLILPPGLPENVYPGQRSRLSSGDIDAIKRIYKLP